jgi:predicted Fe-S protein YdhL (DUF1289 family)
MPKLQASTAPKAFWNPALEGGSPIYHREVGYVALVAHRSLRCHKLSPRDHADVALIGEQTVNPRLQEPHLLVDGPAVCRGIGPDAVVDRQERFLGADRVGMDLQTGCMGFGHHVVGWARMPSVLRPMIWRLLRSTTVKGAGRSTRPEPAALAAAVSGLLAMPEGQRRKAARTRAESFPWSRTTDTMLALHGLQPAVRPG